MCAVDTLVLGMVRARLVMEVGIRQLQSRAGPIGYEDLIWLAPMVPYHCQITTGS